ncbi:hypothetical protein BaOVIS_025650 [Babesia ovis]|uniref:BRCT domain-containing protein n=1 Tax=Babesia ovis TaxID=5869 RepID=A0A9W5TD33_BABOV|nr:hypothetical protein BaOVIS_025650 [Babesia ovis]
MMEHRGDSSAVVRQCRHITYIQSNFISRVLKLGQPEVVNEEEHRCFIPTCENNDVEALKAFYHMGNPGIKTYHPINYIGIGIHRKQVDTTSFYTAYLPLNLESMGNDKYVFKRTLLRLIDGGKLWLPENSDVTSRCSDPVSGKSIETNKNNIVTSLGGHNTGHGDTDNVFKLPMKARGVKDGNKYIFATPSCMYATMPEMASVVTFDDLPVALRIVIEVLVRPGTYTVGEASLSTIKQGFDCCFPNESIEWFIDNTEDVVVNRLLFRIVKKEEVAAADSGTKCGSTSLIGASSDTKSTVTTGGMSTLDGVNMVDLITVVPTSSLAFLSESGFQELRGIYTRLTNEDSVVILDGTPDNAVDMTLGIKLKWTEHNNKVVYYLKTLIGSKWMEWDNGNKWWKAKAPFLYECVKFGLYLGLKISDPVLFALWRWLKSIGMRGITEAYSKVQLIQWLGTNNVWLFQRVGIKVEPGYNPAVHGELGKGATPAAQAAARDVAETVEIVLVPFNKDVVARFKERNANSLKRSSVKDAGDPHGDNTYTWNKDACCWQTAHLKMALEDIMAVLPHLRECSLTDTFLSDRGINLRDINKLPKRRDIVQDSTPAKRQELDVTDESHFDTVTKLMITAAGKEPHLMRIRNKIKTVVEKVAPPSSSISASGKIMRGGAGTGGIEFVEAPRGTESWNKISLCVVPNEDHGEIPVDQYDPQLLASLVGEVYIVKEAAIDYLLANFKRWPGPHDTVAYSRWTDVMTAQEASCWGQLSFDARQKLAQSRLFCDEDFYVSGEGDSGDSALCQLLVELGNGKLVTDARDAEYVVITDKRSDEALELKRLFARNDEDVIANTHGARHSTLVTPKFIYDCILSWRLQRPTKSQGHMAF